MRYVRRLLRELTDTALWWRLSVLLCCCAFGLWVPANLLGVQTGTFYLAVTVTMTGFALFLTWWFLHIAETVSREAQARATLVRALQEHRTTRVALEGELEEARHRVEELTRAIAESEARAASGAGHGAQAAEEGASSWEHEVVTVGGPRTAVSFYAGDLVYASSTNRARTAHLATSGSLPIDVTLSSLLAKLPEGHFALCHRSMRVNLHRVSRVSSDDIILDDGTQLPVSRRRAAELRAALEAVRGR